MRFVLFLYPHPEVASFGQGSRAAAIVAAVLESRRRLAVYASLAVLEPPLPVKATGFASGVESRNKGAALLWRCN